MLLIYDIKMIIQEIRTEYKIRTLVAFSDSQGATAYLIAHASTLSFNI